MKPAWRDRCGRVAVVWTLIAGAGAAMAGAVAQPAPAETWRVAPLFGGEVHSVAFAPTDPAVAIAGTAAGQVYVSRDGGGSWQHAGRTFPLPGWVVAALSFDPNRPTRVWAALRGVWGGGGLVRSDDLGKTWDVRSLLPDDEVFAVALVPGEEGRLFLGTRSGVLGSTDGGKSWRHLSGAHPGLVEVSSLLVHPQRPGTVLAGTFRRAFRSDDGGATWRGVFDGMALDSQVFSLTSVPGSDAEVWASTCGWVYRSGDLGESWARFKDGLAERRTPSFDVLPDGRLLAGTVGGLFTSDDGGKTWTRRSRADLSILGIAYHPRRPEVVLLATEGSGVWRSTDGGSTFQPAGRGITSPRVTALAAGGGELLAAVAHGGPATGLYGSRDGHRFLHLHSQIPTVLSLAIGDAGEAWAGTEQGLFVRRAGAWEVVGDVAPARVEQVVAARGRVLARTTGGLLERQGGRFVALRTPAPAQSAVLHGEQLLVSGGEAAWQLVGDESRPVGLPGAGQLGSAAGRLFVSGNAGAWSRGRGEAQWRVHAEGRSRVLPTGDAAFPAVLAGPEGLELLRAIDGRFHRVELPFHARDVVAAAVHGGRLFLGTSGFGLVYAALPDLVPPDASGTGTIAGGGR
jgi:photosystem II stability/assembly factor-like uncharacterized protein